MRPVRHLLTIIALATFAALSGGVGWAVTSVPAFVSGDFSVPEVVVDTTEAKPNLLFLGDVMLARHVERLSRLNGVDYPWRGVRPLLDSAEVVVVNFESAIPQIHRPTPDFTFRFSTPGFMVDILSEVGVTHASLANNHSFDFGATDFVYTRERLASLGIEPFGHPNMVDDSSVTYIQSGNHTIALIGIHTLFRSPSEADLIELLTTVQAVSDVQIAYIHWGVEYVYEPSPRQRALAEKLIAHGVSAIIGHHPHVVQNVEFVSGVPVFYSLGNFIFDQYFTASVQDGLALRVQVQDDEIQYELIPVTSRMTRSQPQVMEGDERMRFLVALAERSDPLLRAEIVDGRITQRLATSAQNSIMAE